MKSIGDDSAEDNISNQSKNDALNKTNIVGKQEKLNEFLGISRPQLVIQSPKDIKKVRPFPTQGKTISTQRILLYERKTRIGK